MGILARGEGIPRELPGGGSSPAPLPGVGVPNLTVCLGCRKALLHPGTGTGESVRLDDLSPEA